MQAKCHAFVLLSPPSRLTGFFRVPTQCDALLQVADQLGCSRRALKVATPEQCCSVFGYMPGKLRIQLPVSECWNTVKDMK